MPKTIHIPAIDIFDEELYQFVTTKPTDITVEHSLISLSLWEAKWHISFLSASEKNELTIDNASKNSGVESNADDMFSGITKGYDVKLQSETDKAWYFKCKKSKGNKDKNDPKKMDLIVEKGTYYPISLSTKAMIASISIHDVSFGVTEDQVTFNPAAYPNAKVIDKRK